jgi:hypothetical protein
MDPDGLSLAGLLPLEANQPTGCIAKSGGRPLLTSPPHPRLHASAWLQFVAGPAPGWVPATREVIEAASRLPLPDGGVHAADVATGATK